MLLSGELQGARVHLGMGDAHPLHSDTHPWQHPHRGAPTQGLWADSGGPGSFTWYFHLQQGEQLEEEDGYPAESVGDDDEEEALRDGDFPGADAPRGRPGGGDTDGVEHAGVSEDDGDEGCEVQAWRGRGFPPSTSAGLVVQQDRSHSPLEGAEAAPQPRLAPNPGALSHPLPLEPRPAPLHPRPCPHPEGLTQVDGGGVAPGAGPLAQVGLQREANPVPAVVVAEGLLAPQGDEAEGEAQEPDGGQHRDGLPPARPVVAEGEDDGEVLLQGHVGQQQDGHLGGQHGQAAQQLALQAAHPALRVLVVLARVLEVEGADDEEVDAHQPVCTWGEARQGEGAAAGGTQRPAGPRSHRRAAVGTC